MPDAAGTAPALLWLRNDLRFSDNPAMRAAADSGQPVLCVYVLEEPDNPLHRIGSAQAWWLHHSLSAFAGDLEKRGGRLILRRGDPKEIIPALTQEIGASDIFWNRRYAPWHVETDTAVKAALAEDGRTVRSMKGTVLYEPWEIETKTGIPYRVFTPFWKNIQARDDVRPTLPRVDKLSCEGVPEVPTDNLDDWDLLPERPDWSAGFHPVWQPGEKGAQIRWKTFLTEFAAFYDDHRNRPDLDQTSRLSPHLHFGEISPVTLWHDMRQAMDDGIVPVERGKTFLSEVVWREFSTQLTHHNHAMLDAPLMEKFARFRWNDDPQALNAWQRGQTGYPIVDAGMRQLWQEGWMHNRVRMIVGSFLVKDLLIDWRDGMAWFWDTLLDADPANNTASWQWIAGCGADAAPFFRIFNPTSQGQKFDPNGDYVRKYVPELSGLPKKYIHAPETAPPLILHDAGVKLGETYPAPLVDHGERRKEALDRYEAVKG